MSPPPSSPILATSGEISPQLLDPGAADGDDPVADAECAVACGSRPRLSPTTAGTVWCRGPGRSGQGLRDHCSSASFEKSTLRVSTVPSAVRTRIGVGRAVDGRGDQRHAGFGPGRGFAVADREQGVAPAHAGFRRDALGFADDRRCSPGGRSRTSARTARCTASGWRGGRPRPRPCAARTVLRLNA